MTDFVKRILILSANPKQTEPLRLDEEARNIKEALRRSTYRDRINLETAWAVTPRTLQRSLLDESPQIVHFRGHGEGKAGLIFEDEQGQAIFISTEALSNLFSLFAERIECVVLNACYSEEQAKAIVQHIPFVVGMSDAIDDQAAIEFAVSFYDAIGAGKSYEFAWKSGCVQLQLQGSAAADIPIFKTKVKRSSVPQVWLQGWAPIPPNPEPPDELLDWTAEYSSSNSRSFPTLEQWERNLAPQLQALKTRLNETFSSSTIEFRSTFSLPAILAVGHTFPEVGHYTLRILLQNQDVWRSDTSLSNLRFRVVQEQGQRGKHLLVGLSVTGNLLPDLERWAQTHEADFDAIVYAEIESGVGSRAIATDADANALAIHAKDLLRHYRQQYGASCLHLVLFAPAGFSLLLGHRLNRLGEVLAYEWDAETESYRSAVRLWTG